MKLYLIFIILLTIIYFCLFNYNINSYKESYDNTNLSYNYDGCTELPPLLKDVMNEFNINSINNDWDYFIQCDHDCKSKITELENIDTVKKVFMIDGCDWPASKLYLWKLLKEYYGNDAEKYMPRCFLLDDQKDLDDFKIHFENKSKERKNNMFFLKNYKQRQEGLKIINILSDAINGLNDGFYLVQDYLYDPFLINKHKINFRYYTLIICRNNQVEGYIHNDGFVYYTPEYYDENSIDPKKHITTGYIDRKIYDTNPLTLQDFRNHLNRINPNLETKWNNNVNYLMSKIIKAVFTKVCQNKKIKHHVLFQLFGSDIAPTSDLNAFLMEINKGPDLTAKDERDKQVKLQVQRDIFKLIENNNINNRFIKIF
jgi:hypothetical protein